ncbi:hypothetical protein FFLO_06983 [Filobasidium floriforme]|uniref:Uncharacterized protein n=1 Tax=Filobasidium floriforme TaxID=5210 RepID=A0A8K0JF70_9TREE|nr:uncharacterized protein HD553DRAFT_343842 [Filobasidium floriforme]KAG7527388.1 hypothetical protein FFLO_06983 [Filobasidium floriforme]KAH8081766.1 hypothetical protein HD553DRAFT_343842 [Filobasidium floriforme]
MSVSRVDMNTSTFGDLLWDHSKDLSMQIEEFQDNKMSLLQTKYDSEDEPVYVNIEKEGDRFSVETNLAFHIMSDSFHSIEGATAEQQSYLLEAEKSLNNPIRRRRKNDAATEKQVLPALRDPSLDEFTHDHPTMDVDKSSFGSRRDLSFDQPVLIDPTSDEANISLSMGDTASLIQLSFGDNDGSVGVKSSFTPDWTEILLGMAKCSDVRQAKRVAAAHCAVRTIRLAKLRKVIEERKRAEAEIKMAEEQAQNRTVLKEYNRLKGQIIKLDKEEMSIFRDPTFDPPTGSKERHKTLGMIRACRNLGISMDQRFYDLVKGDVQN